MSATLRLLVCASALAVAGSVVELAQPGWIVQQGTTLVHLLKSRVDLRAELELMRQLDEESAALAASIHTKHQVLKELLDGRLTLLETAMRFREIDTVRLKGQPNPLHAVWPGGSELERYCNHIVGAARNELWEQPSRSAAVLTRLKDDFQAAAESGVFCLLR